MEEDLDLDLHSVRVHKVKNEDSEEVGVGDYEVTKNVEFNLIQEFPNMISAKVIKGRVLEMEHSKLVGESVKFKTVINFDQILNSKETLGITLVPQKGYINKVEAP